MSLSRSCFLDFEFFNSKEPKMALVCATLWGGQGEPKEYWLLDDSDTRKLTAALGQFTEIICYNAVAEARSLISLGLDPLDWEWVDLYLEYRMLLNHNHKWAYGKQLVDGKVKFTVPPKPKWEQTEEEKGTGFKPTYSYAEACYKLLGKFVDTKEKDEVRDLIISGDIPKITQDKDRIQKYCTSDVTYLPKMFTTLEGLFGEDVTRKEMRLRGRYAAHTAWMEQRGYPIDYESTRRFSRRIPSIIFDCQHEINSLFPDIRPFELNKKTSRYTWKQRTTRDWIAENVPQVDRWMKTDTGQLSLSLDAWQQFFDFKHEYPKDNFGAQMVRFLKLKQAMNGFSETGDRSFWDYVGSDHRVRPYMNIYGAQSGRSQPAATGFMFLKPAWMRALVKPQPGRAIIGVDYASQEFFVSALVARDKTMIEAYLSGDPYLALGKATGVIPANGTKETHKKERDLMKSTTLGISYLMSKYGLANKLTQDTGRVWDEDEAQEQIDLFYEAYSDLKEFQTELIEEYEGGGSYIKLPCGWIHWGDNPNFRSVANVPIQGFGASVMRLAVEGLHMADYNVIFTLHDAVYIEVRDEQVPRAVKAMCDIMRDAFVAYFPADQKEIAAKIRLDPYVWGPNWPEGTVTTPGGIKYSTMPLYIDERGIKEWEKFKHYLEPGADELL